MTEKETELRSRAAKAQENIAKTQKGRYRCKYHLMPPTGWLNDPNGLCRVNGIYHVFFQYAPEGADGSGMRSWGHYVSKDLLCWKFLGVAIYPDSDTDADGAYSGSAVPEGEGFSLYYTGNVKHKDKKYDYISDGRESNTTLIRSKDGFSFGEKKILLKTSDYPENFTRHIRDPKVYKTEKGYEMVLGGRMKGDQGAVLFYESQDGEKFTLREVKTTQEKFGYMWECPDFFEMNGTKFLCVSPQGVGKEKYRFQNVYSSGYFSGELKKENFSEWDFGFDFYAPQTFFDGERRILFGWVGMPDVPYDNQPTVKEGWQHTLTLPRVLTEKEGRIIQSPAEELKKLRGEEIAKGQECECCEILLDEISESAKAVLCDALEIEFKENETVFCFRSDAGRGRTVRRTDVRAEDVRIFLDVSVCEVYINGGERVFTTRLYPERYTLEVHGCRAKRYAMRPYTVEIEIKDN